MRMVAHSSNDGLDHCMRWGTVIEHTPPLSEVYSHHTPVTIESLPEMGNEDMNTHTTTQ